MMMFRWINKLGIGYCSQLQKNPPFSGFLRKSSREGQKIPPFPQENGNMHAAPLCIQMGARAKHILYYIIIGVSSGLQRIIGN